MRYRVLEFAQNLPLMSANDAEQQAGKNTTLRTSLVSSVSALHLLVLRTRCLCATRTGAM
jgi:hypothetical protein